MSNNTETLTPEMKHSIDKMKAFGFSDKEIVDAFAHVLKKREADEYFARQKK